MLERSDETSWAHFEVVADGGWFKNLLYGKQPWVEVALMNQHTLQLNLGISKTKRAEMRPVPVGWPQEGKGLWTVPVGEIEVLIDWTNKYLAAACGNPDYRVSGWIEGL